MRRRIIMSLFAIFILFSSGAGISLLYINDTTDDLNHIIELHEVEQHRRSLVINLQTVQASLYSVNTLFAKELDSVISEVSKLEGSAQKCTSCHHPQNLTTRIVAVQSLIKDYENHLSYLITTSANEERLKKLKSEVIAIGNKLIDLTSKMSHSATDTLNRQRGKAMEEIGSVKLILLATLMLTFLLSTIVSIRLTRSVAKPVKELLNATRQISSGEYGITIDFKDRTEFGELAEHFNTMSTAIKNGYDEIGKEIDVRKQAEASLIMTKGRLHHLLVSTPAVIYGRVANNDFLTTFISDNAETLLGYESKEFMKDPKFWLDHIHPDDKLRVMDEMPRVFQLGHNTLEYRFKHKSEMYIWVQDGMKLLRDDEHNPLEIVGYLADITQHKKLEQQMLHDSLHDSLTNLPNRTLFFERMNFYMARAKRHKSDLFAVLFIDIDRFKNVNDSLGHMSGDLLLTLITRRLNKSMRPDDMIARLGGDEFAILVSEVKNIEEVEKVSERIHQEMDAPFNLTNNEIYLSASIGIAINDISYDNPEQLLRDADIAMYQAKAKGGACHVVFDKSMHSEAVARLQMESDLRHALEHNEFSLNFQPIVESETAKVIGFEALLRWEHPVYGFISPEDFIPLAEETGVILPIGEWVLYEACRTMSHWQDKYPEMSSLTISVNISSKQFNSKLIELVRNVLQETGLEAERLNLEITESLLMENEKFVADLLSRLTEMNVGLQIDDFGTGYSSLSYLNQFPIDTLKIDRSFIGKINSDNEDQIEVVKAIITLAYSLNMDVIAEGVETEVQANKLKMMKCNYLQGYFFAKPMDIKTVETYFEQNQIIIKL